MPTRAKTKKAVEKPTKKTPKMAEKSRNKGTGINLKSLNLDVKTGLCLFLMRIKTVVSVPCVTLTVLFRIVNHFHKWRTILVQIFSGCSHLDIPLRHSIQNIDQFPILYTKLRYLTCYILCVKIFILTGIPSGISKSEQPDSHIKSNQT